MYNVIVVDDEFKAAKLIETYINRFIEGFRVINIFEDGTDAVEYLNYHDDVDVIITDIKMRRMSGVDLAKYVHYTMPNIKVILVSAYAEFEYAKDAIKYGVFGYLLKVVDIKELTDMMKNLEKVLNQAHELSSEDIDLVRECFFIDLLSKKYADEKQMNEHLEKCVFPNYTGSMSCRILEISFEPADDFFKRRANVGKDKTALSLIGIIKCADHNISAVMISGDKNKYYIGIVGDKDSSSIEMLENAVRSIFSMEVKITVAAHGNFESIRKNPPDIYISENTDMWLSKSKSRNADMIEEAKKYIKEHLAMDISRDDVANYVHLNPGYFGKLFKSFVGITFSDYLSEQRLKCAQELLKQGMRTNEVCEKIGYRDEKHFRLMFFKYKGMTPAAYRKSVGSSKRGE